MLLGFVVLYLLITIVIGLYAARRVKGTADYAVAGRHLPFVMIVTTTFATWFGSETVLGIPARFAQGGLGAVVEDPFGAGVCLILVGLLFAAKLYKLRLLTLGDYYRVRFGSQVEVLCSVAIIISYLGWVSAQVTALGLVFNMLTNGAISVPLGMVLGVLTVLCYALFGGMWSVAVTDFLQMIVLVVGLVAIALFAADLAGGVDKVVALASSREMFRFFPPPNFQDIIFFIAAALTMMLGSIPQQDVFQRVMSANSEHAAKWGPVVGGVSYIFFAFVPMFLVACSLLVMPGQAEVLMQEDPQKILPTLVLSQMPLVMQVLFFGALLAAIQSTASATLLAPSVTLVQNVWRKFRPHMSDQQELRAMRLTVFLFALFVLFYAVGTMGTPIYDMVSGAYQVTLVGALVPLVFGIYWKRANKTGALLAVALGVGVWLLLLFTSWGAVFPAQLAGLLASVVGMVGGSLMVVKR